MPPTTQAPQYQAPTTQAPQYQGPRTAQPGGSGATVQDMAILDRVNRIRAQHGLRALRFDPNLWVAARDHSAEQRKHGYMGHGSPDPARRTLAQRMGQASYGGRVFAEVVAWGYSDTASVVEGWMNSPDHRRILLDAELTEGSFSRVGEYWTGNLGAPARLRQPTPVPRTGDYSFRRAPAPTPRATQPYRAPTPQPRASAPAPQPRRTQPAPAPRRTQPKLPIRSSGFG